MKGTIYTDKASILKRAKEIIGLPLGSIDTTGRLSTGKGAIGTVVEESWFGYVPNSESEPDFPEAGVELKVTPYINTPSGKRAKERLVCNIINYMAEYDKTFYQSAFWHKCNTMLLMSYEHLFDCPKSDYHIDAAILFSFPKEDLLIIEHDWKTIMEKVRAGRAHEISEGDTLYLAACTKGANASSVRAQPFSDIPAKQRAYSLKSSYMTQVLNKYIFGDEENEKVIKDPKVLQNGTFEYYIEQKLKPFFGKTQKELLDTFAINSTAKNINELILAKALGIKGKVSQTEEFMKAGIIPKTIRVQKDGTIEQSMSFPAFSFVKLAQEKEWEDSELYNYLAPTKFLFVVFQENQKGEFVFDRIKFWNIPNDDLEEVGKVWKRTVATLNEGVRLVCGRKGVSNNLPKQSESRVAHVRPHTAHSAYIFSDGTVIGDPKKNADELPDGQWMTKQCFWLNNTYIADQIKEK